MASVERGINPADFKFFAPTESVDGTPVAGPLTYNVYRVDEDGGNPVLHLQLPQNLNQDVDGGYRVPVTDFTEGRWVLALTAVDAHGDESALSNTLGFRIGVAPNPPLLVAS